MPLRAKLPLWNAEAYRLLRQHNREAGYKGVLKASSLFSPLPVLALQVLTQTISFSLLSYAT